MIASVILSVFLMAASLMSLPKDVNLESHKALRGPC